MRFKTDVKDYFVLYVSCDIDLTKTIHPVWGTYGSSSSRSFYFDSWSKHGIHPYKKVYSPVQKKKKKKN